MKRTRIFLCYIFLLALTVGFYQPAGARVQAPAPSVKYSAEVSAYDLIAAMNSLRVSNGLPALVEDPIINAVAQSTAQIMAANQMSWHIGDVSGRLTAAGYGGGSRVWATENFAVGNQTIDEIMVVWSDASHMLPAVVAAYCHVGAGTAKSTNGMTYYILQAAYTDGKSCGPYNPPNGNNTPGADTTPRVYVSQIIMPVKIATPDVEGKIFHSVLAGQTFWAIAIAYHITIKDLKSWNNLADAATLKMGQKLFIPGKNTVGYATPTQPGGIQISTPDAAGNVMHVVQSYQTLSTIANAYGTTVDAILALNSIKADWPLQIGQKLLLRPGDPAVLDPILKLTASSDGKYYHSVQSGETLLWIASQYGVLVKDLMAWNGLSNTSIIRPEQKLLLLVTPPASITPSPKPATATQTLAPATPDLSATPTASPTPVSGSSTTSAGDILPWIGGILLLAGLGLGFFFLRRKPGEELPPI